MPETYIIKGTGQRVTLSKDDFIAKGGEKSVYEKNGIAYCIYHDASRAIPSEKIRELSVLTMPQIIKPEHELLDIKKRRCGETTRFVTDSHAPNDSNIKPLVLCHLFTNAFRRKNKIENKHIVAITDRILEIVKHCHEHDRILVDPNETNWLVTNTINDVRLIDTSCIQTPNYPGSVIKLSIRDWSRNYFSKESDYYSIAIVIGQLWAGIHPYLAAHQDWINTKPDQALRTRMEQHISFFDSKTIFNRACRPLSEIPGPLYQWLKSTLQDGHRHPPPKNCGEIIVIPVETQPVSSTRQLDIDKVLSKKKNIIAIYGSMVNLMPIMEDDPKAIVFTTIYNKAIEAKTVNNKLKLTIAKKDITINCDVKNIFVSDNRLYAVSSGIVNEIVFNEISPQNIRATVRHVGSIIDSKATRVFPGCIIQNILGRYLLSIFPKSGKCSQFQLRELEGWQILSAKYDKEILVVSAESGGKYKSLIYYLGNNKISDPVEFTNEYYEVNFCVTNNNICVLMTPNGRLLIFRTANINSRMLDIDCPIPDAILHSIESKVIGIDGGDVYNISMK